MKESGGPRQAFRLSGDLGGANFPDDAPPVDGRATVEERFSARPLTSDLGNSTITNVQQRLQQRHCLSDTATIRFYGPGSWNFSSSAIQDSGSTLSAGLPSLERRKGQSKSQ